VKGRDGAVGQAAYKLPPIRRPRADRWITVADMGKATVVLVDRTSGGELAAVRDALSALDTPAILISRRDLGTRPLGLDVDAGLLHVDNQMVRPEVAWVRHCSAPALLHLGALAAATWSGFLVQLTEAAGVRLPGSAPAGTGQLASAARLGVRTPRTVVGAGMEDLLGGQVIVKTPDFRLYEPDRKRWTPLLPSRSGAPSSRNLPGKTPIRDSSNGILPGKFPDLEVPDLEAPELAERDLGAGPQWAVVVQEYVPHTRELRVYHLNGGICAFEVRQPEPSSLWTDPASVTVTRADCPPAAAEAVRTLCAAWGLCYGAFDILVTGGGEPVLLEANADGDWLWYERKARWHGVSFMAAVMVRELFVSTVGRSSRR
jgi:hypothetical protein